VEIYHYFINSRIPANFHPDLQHGYTTYGDQTLWNLVRNRPEPRAMARCQ